jgi:hypothetical protein
MRCFFVLGNLPHEDLIAPAIFPQKLLSGFLELFFHLGDGRGIHRHSSLPFSCPTFHPLLCEDEVHIMPMHNDPHQIIITIEPF